MTLSVLRTSEGWWVQKGANAVRVDTAAATTHELLHDRGKIPQAFEFRSQGLRVIADRHAGSGGSSIALENDGESETLRKALKVVDGAHGFEARRRKADFRGEGDHFRFARDQSKLLIVKSWVEFH